MNPSQSVIDSAVDEAVKQASSRGWEAIVLLLFMIGLMVLTGVIVKWLIRSMDARMEEATARENRMALRLNKLEEFSQTTLVNLINETAAMTTKVMDAITSLSDAMNRRPCLLPVRTQLADSHNKTES